MSTLYEEPERHEYLEEPIRDIHHRLILAGILETFRVGEGARVVEVGAGAGRYTSLLLERGLRVLAMEPDRHLAEKLKGRYAEDERARTVMAYPYEVASFPPETSLVCGFHVLHHMDASALERLGEVLGNLPRTHAGFRGWFFLEPNSLNPLYPIQIALRSSMRFREERGLWLNRYGKTLGAGGPVRLGYVGYFPPNRLTARFPARVQRLGTHVVTTPSPARAYLLVGRVVPADDDA